MDTFHVFIGGMSYAGVEIGEEARGTYRNFFLSRKTEPRPDHHVFSSFSLGNYNNRTGGHGTGQTTCKYSAGMGGRTGVVSGVPNSVYALPVSTGKLRDGYATDYQLINGGSWVINVPKWNR